MSEIHIYGPIGADHGGVTAQHVIEQLRAGADHVRIHSEGGDADTALIIAGAITAYRQQGRRIGATVEGLAASAASIIASACEPRRIVAHGLVMVHEPQLVPARAGTPPLTDRHAGEHTRTRILDSMVSVYMRCIRWTEARLRAALKATTWLDADEAIAAGFATEKVDGLRAVACLDRSSVLARLGHPPARYRRQFDALVRRAGMAGRISRSVFGLRVGTSAHADAHGWREAFARARQRTAITADFG